MLQDKLRSNPTNNNPEPISDQNKRHESGIDSVNQTSMRYPKFESQFLGNDLIWTRNRKSNPNDYEFLINKFAILIEKQTTNSGSVNAC